ncbi:NAD-dependent epimerase/dehydratase family protein, partial [Lacticaseibacillus rhamnosus]
SVQFVRDSVENHATVNILMSCCDAVFHLAAAVGVQLIIDEPVRTISTTIHGTEVGLEAAKRYGRPGLSTWKLWSPTTVVWSRTGTNTRRTAVSSSVRIGLLSRRKPTNATRIT